MHGGSEPGMAAWACKEALTHSGVGVLGRLSRARRGECLNGHALNR